MTHAREPVPDVVCRSADAVIYYELTQVDAARLHGLVACSQSSRADLFVQSRLLTSTEWPLFRVKYRGFVFDLGEHGDSIHPKNAVKRVFRYLLNCDPRIDYPQGPCGETIVPYDDINPEGRLDASLYRLHQGSDYLSICYLPGVCLYPMTSVKDPEIWHGAVTSRNPAISAIATKSEKAYHEEFGQRPPLPKSFHLVLWTDISGFLEETTEYLKSASGRTIWEPVFGSVWLFDRVHQRVTCHAFGRERSG